MPLSSSRTALDIAYAAVFAALIIVCAFFSVPVGAAGVPVVLQNAVIVLSGLVLGARRGGYAAGLFLLVGLVLPVLAGGRTVLSALAGPTAGYLVGYLISAVVAGFLSYRVAGHASRIATISLFIIIAEAAFLIQYAAGILCLMAVSKLSFSAAAAAQVPFLLPDFLKGIVIAIIAASVHAALPSVRQSARQNLPAPLQEKARQTVN